MKTNLKIKLNLGEEKFTKIFFYTSVILAVSSLSFYLYVIFSIYQSSKDIVETQNKINSILAQSEKDRLERLFILESRVNDFKKILAYKNIGSGILDFLEENTINNIYFESAELDFETSTLKVSGNFPSLKIADQQVLVFLNSDKVLRASVDDLSFGQNGIKAVIKVVLKDDLIKENI